MLTQLTFCCYGLQAHGLHSPTWSDAAPEAIGKAHVDGDQDHVRLSDKEAAECLLALATEKAKAHSEGGIRIPEGKRTYCGCG